MLLMPHTLLPVYGEKESQCCDGPLSARQLLHRAVALAWGDDVVVDAPTEGLLEKKGRGGGKEKNEREER